MHRTVTAEVGAPIDRVFSVVADLSTYPDWLDLVAETVPQPQAVDDAGPVWLVTLRAQIGPFARAKKLRMVRVISEAPAGGDSLASRPGLVRFERREVDGRNHSSWVLESCVEPDADGRCAVTMDLRYDGALWTAPLEPVLGAIINRAGSQLEAYASSSP